MRAVPYFDQFIESLKTSKTTTNDHLFEDMKKEIQAMKSNIDVINHFYKVRQLKFDEAV